MTYSELLKLLESLVKVPCVIAPLGTTHNHLVYVALAEGELSLWSLNLKTKVKRRLVSGVRLTSIAEPNPKSRFVVYTIDISKGRELSRVYAIDIISGKVLDIGSNIEPGRVMGIAFDGEKVALSLSYKDKVSLILLRLDGVFEELHRTDKVIFVSSLNEDLIAGYGVLKGNPRAFELFFYDLRTSEFKVYTPRDGTYNVNPLLHGRRALFETNAFGKKDLYIYDYDSSKIVKPSYSSSDYKYYEATDVGAYNWLRDGRIGFILKSKGRARLFIDGSLVKLPEGNLRFLGIGDNEVYVSHESLSRPPRVFKVDLRTLNYEVMIDNELPKEINEKIGTVRYVEYSSFDGLRIPTYVIESRATSKPGPTIIYVHGGPWAEVADSWDVLIASLVISGFHVVAPNFRGSTGYGEEFRVLDIGDPGGADLIDIVKAREWAIKSGLASKVAIMGYSYGGFMTYLALTKYPDLWDAGVAGAGITDWEEMYELSDEVFKRFIEILFTNKKELLKDRSTIFYADKIKAPLCIIHPQNDSRTPLKPVLKFVNKLLELNKRFEVHIIPDMGHLITTSEDLINILWPAIVFLKKNLR